MGVPYRSAVTPPHPDLLDALRLRRWAIDVLTTGAHPAPEAPPSAWALFLRREACATRLRARLGAGTPPLLRAAADREQQQILLLRAELEAVLDVALELGVAPILLKGAMTLHWGDRALWAKDLDLLLSTPDAARLVTALRSRGWEPLGTANAAHGAELVRPGRPPVEVHPLGTLLVRRIGPDAIATSMAHPQIPGARLLSPVNQALHVAHHQTLQHGSHRGRLRDAILFTDLLIEGGATAESTDGRPLGDTPWDRTFGLVRAIAFGGTVADPFPLVAAAWYQMDLQQAGRRAHPWTDALAAWTLDWIAGEGAVYERLRDALTPPAERRPWWRVRRLGTLPLLAGAGALAAVPVRLRARAALRAVDQRGQDL